MSEKVVTTATVQIMFLLFASSFFMILHKATH